MHNKILRAQLRVEWHTHSLISGGCLFTVGGFGNNMQLVVLAKVSAWTLEHTYMHSCTSGGADLMA